MTADRVPIHLKVPREIKAAFHAHCVKRGKSMTGVLNEFIKETATPKKTKRR